jgi:hypothetical protein
VTKINFTHHPWKSRPVKVFDLRYPGTRLDGVSDAELRFQVETLFNVLASHLADAAVGLAMFEEAVSTPRPARPAPGSPPRSYLHRVPLIHAHTVLYALDAIDKMLGVLARTSGLPAGITAARATLSAALPDLTAIRDSAHYLEDRARGLDRRSTPLPLQPISKQMISAPAGGVLALANLNGAKLGYAIADGRYAEIEISAVSVAAAQASIQEAIDACTWRGHPRTEPY